MIKIEINNETRKKIEDLHWKWFFNRSKKKYNNTAIKEARSIKQILGLNHVKEIRLIVIGNFFELAKKIGEIKKENDIPIKNKNGKIVYNEDLESYLSEQLPIDYKNAIYEKIEQFFNYDSFDRSTIWNPYSLFHLININICPYCNRQYIFTIGSTEKKTVRPELDHFFPQTRYPYLACSLYNFIPSCHICNHGKREFGAGIIYPHEEDFGKNFPVRVKFKKEAYESANLVDIKNTHVFFEKKCGHSLEQDSCEVCKKAPKIKASIKTFHIEDIYNEHTIELKDLFDRYRNYCQPKRKDILRLFHEDELKNSIDGLTEKQIDAVLSLYAKKMKNMFLGLPLGAGASQYPLRKFKEDIIEQLDETRKKMKI